LINIPPKLGSPALIVRPCDQSDFGGDIDDPELQRSVAAVAEVVDDVEDDKEKTEREYRERRLKEREGARSKLEMWRGSGIHGRHVIGWSMPVMSQHAPHCV
jgi:hypothetical protein